MYSRSMRRERRNRGGTYAVPPGYDGSRFRRNGSGGEGEFVPDSDFAPPEPETLSVGGIPTKAGRGSRRGFRDEWESDETVPDDASKADFFENDRDDGEGDVRQDDEGEAPHETPSEGKHSCGGIGEFFRKLGYDGVSRDDLLLIGLIFLLVTDREEEGAGELVLLLALLLSIR